MNNVYIFMDIGPGYGSPQYSYIANEFFLSGFKTTLISPIGELEVNHGYRHLTYRSRFHHLWCVIKTLFKSWFSKVTVVYNFENRMFLLLSPWSKLVAFNYEMLNEEQCNSRINRIIRRRVILVFSPQEDRLNICKSLYVNAKCFLVQNAKYLYSKKRVSNSHSELNVLYQGQINDLSNASSLLELASGIEGNVFFHIAGRVSPEFELQFLEIVSRNKNVTFYGQLTGAELLLLREKCSVGLVTWGDLSIETRFAAPNKLYEYISEGMTVISLSNYSINKLADAYDFGFVCENANQIKSKLTELSLNKSIVDYFYSRNVKLYHKELNYQNQLLPVIDFLKNCNSRF